MELQQLEDNVLIIGSIQHILGFAFLPLAVHLLRLQHHQMKLQTTKLFAKCRKRDLSYPLSGKQ